MFKRIPQPPIDPAARNPERRHWLPGLTLLLLGAALALAGARHSTMVSTVEGSPAREVQLVKALSCGGLQFPDLLSAPPPLRPDDPAAAAEALDRWAKNRAAAAASPWKVRVDPDAKTPCPT